MKHSRDMEFDAPIWWRVELIGGVTYGGRDTMYVKAKTGEDAWNTARWNCGIGEAIESVTPLITEG